MPDTKCDQWRADDGLSRLDPINGLEGLELETTYLPKSSGGGSSSETWGFATGAASLEDTSFIPVEVLKK